MVLAGAWSASLGMAVALAGSPRPEPGPPPPPATSAPTDDDTSVLPSDREVIARDLSIMFAVATLAGVVATVVGAVIHAGAPSAEACVMTGIEGPNGPAECSRRTVGGITLAAGIPVAILGGVGTTVMARRWYRMRTMRLQLSAAALTLRF